MNEQMRAEFESSVDANEHTITSRQCLTEKDTGRVVAVFYNDYDLQEVVDQLQAAHARYAGSGALPNEHGKNRYGLDMSYFRNLINRELNRPLVNYRPDELARVFARASRTADPSVMREPEFTNPVGYAGIGAEAVAYLDEDGRVVRVSVDGSGDGGFASPDRAIPGYWKPLYAHPAPAVPDDLTGAQWSAMRKVIAEYVDKIRYATHPEIESAFLDEAPKAVYAAMLTQATKESDK